MILARVLHSGERMIFMTLFWALILVIVALRSAVLVVDVRFVLEHNISQDQFQTIVRRLGVACFVAIALAECTSAVFLLRRFHSALRLSSITRGGRLFVYLMRSTEIRVATLACIGITRAATFSSHAVGVGGVKGVANQLDCFVVTLQALFPMVMLQVCPPPFPHTRTSRITRVC